MKEVEVNNLALEALSHIGDIACRTCSVEIVKNIREEE